MQQQQQQQQQQADGGVAPASQAPAVYEPLPQRIGANKHKRRRRCDKAAVAAVASPANGCLSNPPSAAAAAAAAASSCSDGDGGAGGSGNGDAQHQQQQQEQERQQPTEYRSQAVGEHTFEYLDHTADVQLHAWGATLAQAFEQAGLALFNYMTPINALAPDERCTRQVSVAGHDLHSLLFNFLDELLFIYSTEYIMMCDIHITRMAVGATDGSSGGGGSAAGAAAAGAGAGADAASSEGGFSITATGRGERFDRARHECGTEVKAITYSAMQVRQSLGDAEVFVIVDI